MKYMRAGFTETSLLFISWLENKHILSDDQIHDLTKTNILNWLYTTSGYYDTDVKGSYFNFNFDKEFDNNLIYQKYIKLLSNSLKNSDLLELCFHQFNQDINIYKEEFIQSFFPKRIGPILDSDIYPSINNKKVIVISSFAKLIKQQILSGNCKKIYNYFPNIIDVIEYTTPYTFFNNGPDKNILVTLDNIKINIKSLIESFDIAIISFGCYTCLLADYIHSELNKDVICIGRMLQRYFGIICNNFDINTLPNIQYWINIPDEYKPIDYKKIEEGCYW